MIWAIASIVTYFTGAVLVSRAVWIHILRLVRNEPRTYLDPNTYDNQNCDVWNYYHGHSTVWRVFWISLFWPFIGLALGAKRLAANGWIQAKPAVRAFYSDPKNKERKIRKAA